MFRAVRDNWEDTATTAQLPGQVVEETAVREKLAAELAKKAEEQMREAELLAKVRAPPPPQQTVAHGAPSIAARISTQYPVQSSAQ